jgi:hypothetical protein
MNINHIELTEDLIRCSNTYPKGTQGELIGTLPENPINSVIMLCIKIKDTDEIVEVTDDLENCIDFHYIKNAY